MKSSQITITIRQARELRLLLEPDGCWTLTQQGDGSLYVASSDHGAWEITPDGGRALVSADGLVRA